MSASTARKRFEHIIHNNLSEFLDEYNILTEHQHGFRKGSSACTQLVETFHDFSSDINNKQIDAIFMEFLKEFDKVFHKKLLYKLKKK